MPNSPLQLIPKPLTREQKVDRYGALEEEIQRFAPSVAEHKALKDEIQSWYEKQAADQPAVVKGLKFTIQMSARKNERTITDQKKAFALLKKFCGSLEGAVAAITIPLGAAIDKFIPKDQHHLILKEEQTGSRSFNCVRNAE